MINLIGDDILAWPQIAAEPGAFFHHYGKKEARPGRKMGHVNRLLPKAPALISALTSATSRPSRRISILSRLPIFTVFATSTAGTSAGSGGKATGAGVFVHSNHQVF